MIASKRLFIARDRAAVPWQILAVLTNLPGVVTQVAMKFSFVVVKRLLVVAKLVASAFDGVPFAPHSVMVLMQLNLGFLIQVRPVPRERERGTAG